MNSTTNTIRLTGSGTISRADGSLLVLSDLIISSEAKITAENLKVDSELEIQGSGSLEAADGQQITITNDVNMSFRAKGGKLPFLGLGQIGAAYDIVPADLVVDVDVESFDKTKLAELSHKLVAGHTLSNCEEWAAKGRLSDSIHFTLTCRNPPSGRLLDGGERALSLVGVGQSTSEDTDPSPTDKFYLGLTQGQLIAVIVSVVVVIIIIIVVVVVVIRRKRSERYNLSDSADSSLHSSSGD
jgi:hypothetical protein